MVAYRVAMDPTYSREAEQYREKIRAFLAENLPSGWQGMGALPEDERREWQLEWRQRLADAQLLGVSWPTEYGGPGLTETEQVVLAEEFAKAGVPTGGSNDGFSISMVGNTIIQAGTEEQKKHFLPRILSGEYVFCQGYSEPDAGSDLANLGLKAEADGDEWVINGQKIWTSSGHLANWIFLLARTDLDAPKHKGISFLLVPMDQPGIEVRPIVNMVGMRDFNEVFFTDARAPIENVVGEVNGGWMVAVTLLGFERGKSASVVSIPYRNEFERVLKEARERGRTSDPTIRQRLAAAYARVEIMRYSGLRTLTDFLSGHVPGPEASLSKLMWSEHHKTFTELSLEILGADAMAPAGPHATNTIAADVVGAPFSSQAWVDTFLGARPGTIYAGTSEIQRNILGERVLGLPGEPRADRGPWKESSKAGG